VAGRRAVSGRERQTAPAVSPPAGGRALRLLVFTTLYPNAAQPHHGIFVENRLRHLLRESGYTAEVVAPVPWFPVAHPRFGRYASFARVPRSEHRHGIAIAHPRFPVIPKLGMAATPWLLYRAARPVVARLIAAGHRFDAIDAHYAYPDGVAAALLARRFGLPFVVTARGTDLNLIPRYPLARRMIRWSAERAAGLITVCDALRADFAAIGVPRERVTVLRNGVDLATFVPDAAGGAGLRDETGAAAPVLASVGHLIPRKGHDLAIRALARLGRGSLLIAGSGPAEPRLRALARALGVAGRVHFLGAVAHTALNRVYSAADVLILASSREGWPNVLLESLACGTPVVATAVNGSPEVVRAPVAGCVVRERTPDALAAAVDAILAAPPDAAAVRRYAARFSWQATSRGQIDLFTAIANG
jgi:glycosyltransferase involved in cell wall biosynthesis